MAKAIFDVNGRWQQRATKQNNRTLKGEQK